MQKKLIREDLECHIDWECVSLETLESDLEELKKLGAEYVETQKRYVPYDDSGDVYLSFVAYKIRPETEDEERERLQKEKAKKTASEASERMQYELLKKKFEKP
jgi:hypothetical protein